jgi:hypothetical protein
MLYPSIPPTVHLNLAIQSLSVYPGPENTVAESFLVEGELGLHFRLDVLVGGEVEAGHPHERLELGHIVLLDLHLQNTDQNGQKLLCRLDF